jgi:precorrin-8X/cobalt-precorrin-8 methylmutase
VLERLVHSSGDPPLLRCCTFSEGACEAGLSALQAGAVILTDTEMAAAAIRPMAQRTLGVPVRTVLEWAPTLAPSGSTRTAAGLLLAWQELAAERPAPVVLIGSAPTALEVLLKQVEAGAPKPSLVIGMPWASLVCPRAKRH